MEAKDTVAKSHRNGHGDGLQCRFPSPIVGITNSPTLVLHMVRGVGPWGQRNSERCL